MRFKSKFAGRCKCCGGHISVGVEIEWSRDYGASHIECWEKFLQDLKKALKQALQAKIAEMNSDRAS